MEGKKFSTVLGNQIEWHTDPDVMPSLGIRHSIIVAFAYYPRPGFACVANQVYFSADDMYLKNDDRTYFIAWAYIDKSVPDEILRQIIEKRKQYEKDHADEIKAKRIAELEAELAKLKK